MQVIDSRRAMRYLVDPPLPARFGRATVSICDLGPAGLQIEHEEPLTTRRGVMQVSGLGVSLDVESEILWSRLLPSLLQPGRYRYRSGIRIGEGDRSTVEGAVERLVESGQARMDEESLERKRRALEARAEAASSERFLKPAGPTGRIDGAVSRRILEARAELGRVPEDAERWEAIGRKRLSATAPRVSGEVVALWEALDHEFEIETIARVLHAAKR